MLVVLFSHGSIGRMLRPRSLESRFICERRAHPDGRLPLIQKRAFEPEAIATMTSAYAEVCRALGLEDRDQAEAGRGCQKGHRVCPARRARPGPPARVRPASFPALTRSPRGRRPGLLDWNSQALHSVEEFTLWRWNVSRSIALRSRRRQGPAAWGARSNIACLPPMLGNRASHGRPADKSQPCCKWRKYGRGSLTRSKPQQREDQLGDHLAPGPRSHRARLTAPAFCSASRASRTMTRTFPADRPARRASSLWARRRASLGISDIPGRSCRNNRPMKRPSRRKRSNAAWNF